MDWSGLFDNYALKKVTHTDKDKRAYVPDMGQKGVLAAAGVVPSEHPPHATLTIKVLNEGVKQVVASYYQSLRATDPSRSPEQRMGLEFITDWLDEGDTLLIGNIGAEIFALKVGSTRVEPELMEEQIAIRANRDTIFNRARIAKSHPGTRRIERLEFIRNPYVVSAALLRAEGVCEMPSCGAAPFIRGDYSVYLEVHHIVPLAEYGDDRLENVAALCPNCHRELHHGSNRFRKRSELLTFARTRPLA